jgi:hypothetical protein
MRSITLPAGLAKKQSAEFEALIAAFALLVEHYAV